MKVVVDSSGNKRGNRRLRNLLALLVAAMVFSAYQYATTGSVTWLTGTARKVKTVLVDYANRPQAGWRRAADAIEDLGEAREAAPRSFDITGKVVSVIDGDTVSVLADTGGQTRVDLYGIDAPDRGQPYYAEATAALTALVAGRSVGISVVESGRIGGPLGTVYLDGENVNLSMVRAGHAWQHPGSVPYDRALQGAEQEARAEKTGLWANPDAVAPWKWRQR